MNDVDVSKFAVTSEAKPRFQSGIVGDVLGEGYSPTHNTGAETLTPKICEIQR